MRGDRAAKARRLPPGSPVLGTFASLVALLVVFSLARSDVFPTVDNLLNIMNQVSILGTMAFGLTVCLVMGLFDLSIAAMATLGGYVATFLLVTYPDIGRRAAGGHRFLGRRRDHRRRQRPDRQLSRHLRFYRDARDGSIITGAMLGISEFQDYHTGIPDEFMIIGQGAVYGVSNPIIIMWRSV